MSEKKPRLQVSATVDQETMDGILEIAEKDRRSQSSVVQILLIQALRERNRKKKGVKND